jgi:hypothetical protein
MARISGEAVEEAKRILRQAYYATVSSEVADLVREYFDGEYDDDDGQRERLSEAADAHVTYTSDQWDTLYSSENSGDGADMLRDLGEQGSVDEQLMRWAYYTFESDVRQALENQFGVGAKLLTPAMEANLDDQHRLIWLAANATKRYLGEFNKGDTAAQYSFLVGTFNPGEQGEVDLGVVTLWSDDGEHVKAQRESTRHFFKDFGETIQSLAAVLSDNPEDEGAWRVLHDVMLDCSVLLGQEPQYEVGAPSDRAGRKVRGGARESTGLIEFLNANSEDIDDAVIARVLSMKVGESDDMGGGATAAFPMTRVI